MKVGVCGESWECVVWWEWMVREWRVCGENGGWVGGGGGGMW